MLDERRPQKAAIKDIKAGQGVAKGDNNGENTNSVDIFKQNKDVMDPIVWPTTGWAMKKYLTKEILISTAINST